MTVGYLPVFLILAMCFEIESNSRKVREMEPWKSSLIKTGCDRSCSLMTMLGQHELLQYAMISILFFEFIF